MKNKYELMKEASTLAQSLLGETNQKKVKATTLAKFDTLGLDDADYPAFEQMLYQYKASFEGLQQQPLETEKLRIAAEAKAKKDQPATEPAA